MIFITYVGSGALLAITAVLFYHHKLTAFTQTYVREKNGGRQEEKRKMRAFDINFFSTDWRGQSSFSLRALEQVVPT